jgi:hypothetical protein
MIRRDHLYQDENNDSEIFKFFRAVYFYFIHQKSENPDILAMHFLMLISIVVCMHSSSLINM